MSFKVTWLGHASFAMDIDGHKVLLDPYLKDNPAANADPGKLDADFILISHGHGDHVGDVLTIARRTGATCVSNHEIVYWLHNQGITNTHAQHIGGGFNYPFGYVKMTIAEHGSMLPDGSDGGNPVGFLITSKPGTRVYFACDTGLFYSMKLIGEEGLDLAFLPIGDNFTMGPDDAFRAVKLLEPKVVIPVHYNTFGVIKQDGAAWVKRVNDETNFKAVLLNPGESYEV
jgi:L-ascorbate metabolism protein UlaG (beta-lactamase superfamily)